MAGGIVTAMSGDTGDGAAARAELTDVERALLDFEHLRWKYAGAKESAVRERFAMSGDRHAQVLNALIDRPEAETYDARLVRRLRRLRAAREAQRTRRPTGGLHPTPSPTAGF